LVEKVATLAREFKSSSFLKQNAILFIGSIAIGVLNYAFYPVLGRITQPVEFGEVQALISLFLQMSVFLNVLTMIAINITANYTDQHKRNQVIFELEKLAIILVTVLLVLTFVFGEQIREFLQFNSTWPFILLMISIILTVPSSFRGAFLRGKQQFGLVNIDGLIGAGGKLIFSVALVLIGFSTNGAIAGMIIAQLLALAYAAFYARKFGLRMPAGKYFKKPDFKLILPELKYAALVFTASLSVVVLSSIDIIMVKHYFDAHTAGLYAGVATVARVLFFLTGSISGVMVTSVKMNAPAKKNRQTLLKSLALLILLSLPVLIVFTLFPAFFMHLLMGDKYIIYADLLRYLSLTMFIVAVLGLVIAYFVALRQYMVGFIAIIGIIVTLTFMLVWHDSLRNIVSGLFAGSVLTVGLLAAWAVASGNKLTRGRIG
jgi:O-antigen/teichoic acid export membrane protein